MRVSVYLLCCVIAICVDGWVRFPSISFAWAHNTTFNICIHFFLFEKPHNPKLTENNLPTLLMLTDKFKLAACVDFKQPALF